MRAQYVGRGFQPRRNAGPGRSGQRAGGACHGNGFHRIHVNTHPRHMDCLDHDSGRGGCRHAASAIAHRLFACCAAVVASSAIFFRCAISVFAASRSLASVAASVSGAVGAGLFVAWRRRRRSGQTSPGRGASPTHRILPMPWVMTLRSRLTGQSAGELSIRRRTRQVFACLPVLHAC